MSECVTLEDWVSATDDTNRFNGPKNKNPAAPTAGSIKDDTHNPGTANVRRITTAIRFPLNTTAPNRSTREGFQITTAVMRSRIAAALFAFAVFTATAADNIKVYFSPKGGCTGAIVQALNAARGEVLVAAFSFTSKPIAEALNNAHKRGVNVSVVLDDSNQTDRYTAATFVNNAGIRTLIDSKHAIAHSKYMVIDRATVITGSFNFTKAAEESNAENLLVIQDRALAAKYSANWNLHAGHSTVYRRKK